MTASRTKAADPTAAELAKFLPAFTAGADRLVVELRALVVPQRYGRPQALTGYFDLGGGTDPFLAAVRGLASLPADQQPEGIYVTLNPVNPDLLARANQRLKPNSPKTISATDRDVPARRWAVIDVDPVRPAGISSTDAEKAEALRVVEGVRADLLGRGFPAPMLADSGNGYHLWLRVDLPADDGGRVERFLKGLARRHDTPAARIDTSMFNPARIVKLPGTFARKGDSLADRPHRMARVLEVPT